MSNATPTIEADIRGESGRAGLAVRTPFSQSFIDALKQAVPGNEREFRPATSSWWIESKHRDLIEGLILARWPELQRLGGKDDGVIVTRGGAVAVQERLL